MVEYGIEEILCDIDTPYQNVKIVKTSMFGNVLLCDDDINLGESDLNYTRAMCGHGLPKELSTRDTNFSGKKVLILGGGDGGLLNYLHNILPKKEQPKFTYQVDIDRVVMEQCRIHLRKACGSILDAEDFSGENYKVYVDDCFKILND